MTGLSGNENFFEGVSHAIKNFYSLKGICLT